MYFSFTFSIETPVFYRPFSAFPNPSLDARQAFGAPNSPTCGPKKYRNIEDAAAAINIATKTLLRWMKLPEFQAAYAEARRAAVSQSNARLQQATGAASTAILKLMVDPGVPPAVRLRAAECVMTHAMKSIELENVLIRIQALEQSAESRK